MKLSKRAASLFVLFLFLLLTSCTVMAEKMPVYPAGQNGKLTWKYEKGILTIKGNDAMTEFCVNGDSSMPGYMAETSAPWTEYRDRVTTIVIEDGVTSIGWFAFYKFVKLTSVYIGKDVRQIDENAFGECNALKTVCFVYDKNHYSSIHIDPNNDCFTEQAAWRWGVTYTPNSKITIKFNANGGKGSMSAITVNLSGKDVKLTANRYKRTNYTFAGWNTKKNGKGTAFRNKASVKSMGMTGTVTLYAQWIKKGSYKIEYELNGGVNNSNNPKSYKKTTKTITLKKANRKGYTFGGWYKDKSLKKKLSSIKKGSSGNLILYAKWTANKYKIAYNSNGGTGSMSVQNCTYDKEAVLKECSFSRKGYVFTGWNTKKDGSGDIYSDQASILNLVSGNGKTITLYAQWQKTYVDETVLSEADLILQRTCEPANRWKNNNKVSYKYDASGYKLWSCGTSANGTLSYINAYNRESSPFVVTECRWSSPILTTAEKVNADEAYEVQKSLKAGTYDFTKDSYGVKIGWSMFTDATSKSEFDKTVNQAVSEEVYSNVIKKYNYYTTMSTGGSCVIVYGKNSAGKMIGMFAGSVYYNNASTSVTYYLVGINPEDEEYYGKTISKTLTY